MIVPYDIVGSTVTIGLLCHLIFELCARCISTMGISVGSLDYVIVPTETQFVVSKMSQLK